LLLATKYQSELDADFGGTEILEPLDAIYKKPPMSTHSRQVNEHLAFYWSEELYHHIFTQLFRIFSKAAVCVQYVLLIFILSRRFS
jgi:hypothetical protein